MTIPPPQYETLTPQQAVSIQKKLREAIDLDPYCRTVKTIAGADVSFNKNEKQIFAGIVILSFPELKILETRTAVSETSFPYIPGLLAFREIPALFNVWKLLTFQPDILIMDGQGIAHPRRMGIATHFGILANTPTIGCAKSLLTGHYQEPANSILATSALYDKDEHIGEVLRTKINCKPVFVSPGHQVSFEQSLMIIKNCVRKYRIPEPTRLAHLLVNDFRVSHSQIAPRLFNS